MSVIDLEHLGILRPLNPGNESAIVRIVGGKMRSHGVVVGSRSRGCRQELEISDRRSSMSYTRSDRVVSSVSSTDDDNVFAFGGKVSAKLRQ